MAFCGGSDIPQFLSRPPANLAQHSWRDPPRHLCSTDVRAGFARERLRHRIDEDSMTVELLIMQYGYVALFIGALLEGETFLILAGFAAHRGYLALHNVIIVAFVGSFLADQVWFHLGRAKGTAFVDRRQKWHKRAGEIRDLIHHRQNLLMLGFRFVPGTRTLTPIIMGAMGFDPKRFALLNGVGALVWAVTIGWIGFLFGAAAEQVIDHIKRYESYLLAAIALLGLVLWTIRRVRNTREATRGNGPSPSGPAPEGEDASSDGARGG
jgi:membrane protein DedA with SNARE-associated domain